MPDTKKQLPSYSLGFSPCPNDTYIFYALTHGLLQDEDVPDFFPPRLEDVETLNSWALSERLDVSKLSFYALGHVLDKYEMLSTGAALGRGCGPLLVTGERVKPSTMSRWRIAIPGQYTTAALLLRLYNPECTDLRIMRFDQIMEAITCGVVDAGVIIHESRFTYADLGLSCIQDLGQWWEELSGFPIPLGCIAAHRSIPEPQRRAIEKAIGSSLLWANRHPEKTLAYCRQYAQEMDDQVMQQHIGLYVNDFSVNLGQDGRAAIADLLLRGQEAGLFSAETALQEQIAAFQQ